MIASFRCRYTEELFKTKRSRRFAQIAESAIRRLDQLNRAQSLQDLMWPSSNRLEALRGDREGQHSIRINARYRICFVFVDGQAEQVEIVDYH